MEDTEGNAKDIDEKLYAQLTEQKDMTVHSKIRQNNIVNTQENT